MSLTTPTTKEISENIVAQLELSLNQTIPLLPKAFNRVLANALAGVIVILYKYGGFIFLQLFVSTASSEETEINGSIVIPLVEWGRLIGVGDPVPAVNAELLIDVNVTNQVGFLTSGSQLVSVDTGVTYLVVSDTPLNAPVVQANVVAAFDESGGDGGGNIGNLDAGATLSFVNPLANVDRDTVVVSSVTTGVDAEEIDTEYRQRVIDRFKKRPQGGAYADYELWAESVNGVIKAYPYAGLPGEVDVYSEVSSDIDPDGIPPQPILDAVLETINLNENGRATRRPVNAWVNSLPIFRTSFTVEVIGLVADNPASVQADITAALEEYFFNAEPFIDGLSLLPKTNRLTQTGIISIVQTVTSITGATFTTATFKVQGSLTNLVSYILSDGEKAKLTNVSYLP